MRPLRWRSAGGFAAVLFVLLAARQLPADTLILTSGGELRGHWLNHEERTPRHYRFDLAGGVRVTLAAHQVRLAVRESDALAQYRRRAPQYAETPAAQWELAEWCRAHHLPAEREEHLRRILLLEPDHRGARRGLGYSQVGGQWMTQDEFKRSRGYQKYRGSWRLPQEVELLEERQQREIAENSWKSRLKRLRAGLQRNEEAAAMIRAIDDPQAVPALTDQLRDEPLPAVRMLYVEALTNIQSQAGPQTLLALAFHEQHAEVFHTVVDHLVRTRPPGIVDQLSKTLTDPVNVHVNRAAMILGRLADDAAILPLIDALVTVHQAVIGGGNGSPGATSTTFGRMSHSGQDTPLGSSMTAGRQPRVVKYAVQNPQVLDALIQLTDVNFGYDQRTWRHWYASRQRLAQQEVRRDDR